MKPIFVLYIRIGIKSELKHTKKSCNLLHFLNGDLIFDLLNGLILNKRIVQLFLRSTLNLQKLFF